MLRGGGYNLNSLQYSYAMLLRILKNTWKRKFSVEFNFYFLFSEVT
jgi:hypothetical protein